MVFLVSLSYAYLPMHRDLFHVDPLLDFSNRCQHLQRDWGDVHIPTAGPEVMQPAAYPIDTHHVATSFTQPLDLRDQGSDESYNVPAYICLEHGELPPPGTWFIYSLQKIDAWNWLLFYFIFLCGKNYNNCPSGERDAEDPWNVKTNAI